LAVRLRLRRMGRKKQPYYRIVAIDSRSARNGKYLENIGTYNPRHDAAGLDIREERAVYWLDRGAKPSETVNNLFKRQGILLRRHLQRLGADDLKIQEATQQWQGLQAEKQKRREAVKAQRKSKAKDTATEPPEAAAPVVTEESGA